MPTHISDFVLVQGRQVVAGRRLTDPGPAGRPGTVSAAGMPSGTEDAIMGPVPGRPATERGPLAPREVTDDGTTDVADGPRGSDAEHEGRVSPGP